MKKIQMMLLMMLFVLPFAVSPSIAGAEAAPRTISVEGESSFYVTPDQASVEIGIETTGTTAADASRKNAAVMTDIQNALYGIGFTQKDIKTASYDFYPVYDKDNSQRITGYKAENTVVVTTNDINNVGSIIDTAVKNGASNVNSVKFSLKDVQKYKDSALKAAVIDAKQKSKAIAGELGKSIVNVVSASESNIYVENRAAGVSFKAMNADMAAPTPISAKDLQVSARVSVTFEIN
ncbi:SIMPL domain-containing protein [Pectinatus frisingensis]|uniref:SIMPL domain-containing protein n=1 Tax=Pectinatus frisingensis TaxID=865 RepID=UPI0018C505EF|nr:SIMPL domain-containing protein [Pectinatus frisingensis]